MPVNASNSQLDWIAPEFNLLSTNDKYYNLDKLTGKNGTVIAFICNHCPYVINIIKKLVFESDELKKIGINTIAIMPNDVISYPADSFQNMKLFVERYNINFPYLYDETQDTAKKYKAECTPDIFGFNKNNILKYRGRIDSETASIINKDVHIERELYKAMDLIKKNNIGPEKQFNSFGCSIKWKNDEKIN